MSTGHPLKQGKRGPGRLPEGHFAELLDQVQVNIPYQELVNHYLDLFLAYGINPEIGFNAAALEEGNEKAMAEVAGILAAGGRIITLHGPFMDLSPGSLDEGIRELSLRRLQQAMELVPLFRPQSLVFHAGYDDRRYRHLSQQWLSSSLATWEPLVRQAEKTGVFINLENTYEQTPEMILALLEAVSSDCFGFCLDVGHINAFARAPLAEWLKALGPYLQEVHLHDNDGASDAHGPIGSGKVPFAELFEYLVEESRRPLLTLEPHEEASLWRSLEKLEKLWPWKE